MWVNQHIMFSPSAIRQTRLHQQLQLLGETGFDLVFHHFLTHLGVKIHE